jgi:hypothetical protein
MDSDPDANYTASEIVWNAAKQDTGSADLRRS